MSKSDSKVYRNRRRVFALTLALALVALALVIESRSLAALQRPEKKNSRISTQPTGSDYTAAPGAFAPMPLLGTIDVDRTDDTAAAATCSVAPNDCSLRGAIAFANVNPATTINVPAGTYNLTI